MQKKLLAVAVAGVLAAPGVALAQSSVTISGFLKMSVENLNIHNVTTPSVAGALVTRPAGAKTSEARLVDDSSRIVFNIREDLGGGLAAIGQVDWRIAPDSAADGGGPTGNNHVGLLSKQWGRVIFGRQDLHYFSRESYLTDKGDLKADSISLIAYAAGGIQAIANATRTPNIVQYTSPNWGGFSISGAYSFNPHAAAEADINSPVRRGYAWNLAPNFTAANWTVGYSYWKSKQDGLAAANNTTQATCFPGGVFTASAGCTAGLVGIAAASDQRSDRLYGSFMWSGFRVGLAWDKSKLEAGPNTAAAGTVLLAGSGTKVSDRTVWSIPLSYGWGNSEVHFHYDHANNDKGAAFSGADSKSKMWAISYNYSLSKRTSFAVQYAQINNGAAAAYNFFTSAAATIGSPSGAINFGEDPRLFSGTIRHAF